MHWIILKGNEIDQRLSAIDAFATALGCEVSELIRNDRWTGGSPAIMSAGISSLARECLERDLWLALYQHHSEGSVTALMIDFFDMNINGSFVVPAFGLPSSSIDEEEFNVAIDLMLGNHHSSLRNAVDGGRMLLWVNRDVSDTDAMFFFGFHRSLKNKRLRLRGRRSRRFDPRQHRTRGVN